MISAHPAFSIRREVSQGIALVAPAGELDMSTVPTLVEQLLAVETEEISAILLDLRELTFMDSIGLKAFLEAAKRSQSNGHRLSFVGVRPEVRRVFEVTGMDSVLDPEAGTRMLREFRDAGSTTEGPDGGGVL